MGGGVGMFTTHEHQVWLRTESLGAEHICTGAVWANAQPALVRTQGS